MLDWVLRGQDQKRSWQGKRRVPDGDLALLHGLQKGGLYFGRGAVDLVCQHEIRKHRAVLGAVFPIVLIVNHGTHNVGRQQIRRELDALKFRLDDRGKRFHGHGFGQAGNAFQQNMTVRQQADEQTLNHVFLADDDFAHLLGDFLDKCAFFLNPGIDGLNVNVHLSSGKKL